MLEPAKPTLLFLHEYGCPVCAVWKPHVDALERKRADLRVVRYDLKTLRPPLPYDSLVTEVPTFRVEGLVANCAPMISAGKLRGEPSIELLERWVDRVLRSLGKGACPRGARVKPVAAVGPDR